MPRLESFQMAVIRVIHRDKSTFLDREERKGIASVGKTDESEQFEGMFF